MIREIDSHPESRVHNSQPHGIGRVVALGVDLVAWNNLGRNVVFADASFRPLAVYDETAFPEEDELSQFDLDIHAIVQLEASGLVAALNHLGILRLFRTAELRAASEVQRVQPSAQLHFAEDVERAVSVGARLAASRTHGSGGLLISTPIDGHVRALSSDPALDGWGPVTALSAWSAPAEDWLAFGAGQRVGVAPLRDGKLGPARWEAQVPWQTSWLCWRPPLLWVAGSDPAPDLGDYDWEKLRGGGALALRLEDGSVAIERAFGCEVAWGNGGAAVCMTRDVLCALDRRGALHAFRARDGERIGSTLPLAERSLGIAHAAAVGDTVLAGFNRAGYRLFAFSVSA